MKIFVLLPAFNEEDSIPRLLPKIHSVLSGAGYNYQIIVTDDGSTDATNRLLREVKFIHCLNHSCGDRGLGETSRDNLKLLQGYQLKMSHCRLDCDDTHEPEFILSMIKSVEG